MSEPLYPPPYRTDRRHLEAVCEVEFIRASGPGGQHRNRRETGVRLVHPPSGLQIIATERRSQSQNLAMAFHRLYARLIALNAVQKERRETRVPRSQQRQRLEHKRLRSAVKATRRRPGSDD